jgi:hypothetical protein
LTAKSNASTSDSYFLSRASKELAVLAKSDLKAESTVVALVAALALVPERKSEVINNPTKPSLLIS